MKLFQSRVYTQLQSIIVRLEYYLGRCYYNRYKTRYKIICCTAAVNFTKPHYPTSTDLNLALTSMKKRILRAFSSQIPFFSTPSSLSFLFFHSSNHSSSDNKKIKI